MLASQLFTFSNARGGANRVTSGQAHLRGHALMLEETWLSVSALIVPKAVYQVEVRTLCRPARFIQTLIQVFRDFALCTAAQPCWKRKEPAPNCSHKVRSMELSKMPWYAKAFRLPVAGTKGPSPAPGRNT